MIFFFFFTSILIEIHYLQFFRVTFGRIKRQRLALKNVQKNTLWNDFLVSAFTYPGKETAVPESRPVTREDESAAWHFLWRASLQSSRRAGVDLLGGAASAWTRDSGRGHVRGCAGQLVFSSV